MLNNSFNCTHETGRTSCFTLKAWSPYKSQRSQAHASKHVFEAFQVCLGLLMAVMIARIHISQKLFAIDMLAALKSSLEHHRKHVLRLLQLYGDQA